MATVARSGVFAAIILLLASPARAQDPLQQYAGRTITDVRLLVEDVQTANPALLSLVDIRAGQPLSIDAVHAVEQRLGLLPPYESVTVEVTEVAGGVVLTFRLSPRHPVDRLEFTSPTGNTGLPPAELERRVRDQYAGLPTGGRVLEVVDVIRGILEEEGYRSADVQVERVLRHNPDRATLRFIITPGQQATIASVQVNGRSPYTVAEITKRTTAVTGAPYREREITAGLADLRNELSAKGYYAAVAQQVPEFTDASVSLTLVVEAGPIVELRIEPPDALPGDVDVLIPMRHEGSVDVDLLDDSKAAIVATLQRQGYAEPDVQYTTARPSEDRMEITFRIARGRRYRVDHVEAPADLHVPPATLVKLLGIAPRDVWNPQTLAAGVGRITTELHRLGLFEAKVAAVRQELPERSTADEAWVAVVLQIEEGPQATIDRITFDAGSVSTVPTSALQAVMQSKPGQPYVVAVAAADARAMFDEYHRRGFADATVQMDPQFSEDRQSVTLNVVVREGLRLTVGDVVVVGNSRIATEEILREIPLRPGAPWSDEARFESRRRLLETSSYRNVTITPEMGVAGETRVRIIVAVEEAPATVVGFGGGLEMGSRPRSVEGGGVDDKLEVSPRAFFEIGRRNLGGRNRSINLFSRVSLKPTNAPGDPSRDGKGFGFAEYRITTTYREQSAFRTDSDVLLGLTSEQAVRTSFNFIRRSANAELLHRFTPSLNVSGRYALEFNRLFDERFPPDEQLLIDRVFPQVRLSYFSGSVYWDRRDSVLAPTRGTLVVADHEIAMRQVGSEVGFVKSFYQVSFFHPLSATRRTVIATRAQFGAARGFERVVPDLDEEGRQKIGPDGQPLTKAIADIPASHRFFAGGSSTVRGFQFDRLGYLRVVNPDGSSNGGVLNEDGLSNGGNALIVLNAEVRTIVGRLFGRSFAVAGFIDGGNVFDRVDALDLGRLRGAVGLGARYDSPLGPIRLDFGFKLNRLVFNGRRERGWEYHLSIGEAF